MLTLQPVLHILCLLTRPYKRQQDFLFLLVPKGTSFPAGVQKGLLFLLVLIMVFFPCWCLTCFSFQAGTLQISNLKFCQGNQTKWPLVIKHKLSRQSSNYHNCKIQWNLDNSKSKGPNSFVWIIETLNNWRLKCIHIYKSGLQNDFELLRILNYWSLNYRDSTVWFTSLHLLWRKCNFTIFPL